MKPLGDLRILAIEQYGAGPFGSLHLSELGADVIKIEDPGVGGDVGRYVPPYNNGEDSLFFESFNRNKRSVSLDLHNAAGRSIFEDLVEHSDAVYSNLRGDVPAKLRIRYDDLKHRNPRIVCCSLSGFGMTGARSSDPAYDYTLQGLSGWMSLGGEPDGPPAKTGLSLVDFSGGFVAMASLLVGVHAARRDGRGMDCDVSLYDTSLALLTYLGTWHLTTGYEPTRTSRSAHPSLVPFQLFPAADGWLVVGCPKEKFWVRLTEVIGRADLTKDERFADFASRSEHRDELIGLLDEIFLTRTVEEWVSALSSASVPCAPVNTIEDAFQELQTRERNLIVSTPHPHFGEVRHVRSPVRVGEEEVEATRAPFRGEHTWSVLSGVLGYSTERISELEQEGAFGGEIHH